MARRRRAGKPQAGQDEASQRFRPAEGIHQAHCDLAFGDFKKRVETDLDEAKRVFALVEKDPAAPSGSKRQSFGSTIVDELLTRDLDLAISFSDLESIWWHPGVIKLATEINKKRGGDGLLAWIDNIEYSGDEGDGLTHKKATAFAALKIVAKDDPERARNWLVANLGQAHIDQYTLQRIAGSVGEDSGLQLKWLAEFPIDKTDMSESVAGVFARYIRSDLDAAGQWLAEQELTAMHDRAIQQFAYAAATVDLEGARVWGEVYSASSKNACAEYYEDFASFCDAIDGQFKKVNTTLREELKTLFALNFQIVDTNSRD